MRITKELLALCEVKRAQLQKDLRHITGQGEDLYVQINIHWGEDANEAKELEWRHDENDGTAWYETNTGQGRTIIFLSNEPTPRPYDAVPQF